MVNNEDEELEELIKQKIMMTKVNRIMMAAMACCGVAAALTACHNGDQDFPDYDQQTVYFAKQYPVRIVELGNDDYVDLTNDNNHEFYISAAMGGAYDNRRDITVDFAVDPSLCSGLSFKDGSEMAVMPQDYYQLEANQIRIPAGEITGGVKVRLTDSFFADPLSATTHYVIPVKMLKADGVDSILTSKNFQLLAVKYVNRYDAYYLDQKANDEYHLLTAGLQKSVINYGAKDKDGKEHNCLLELSFTDDGNCTITTSTEGFTASGSGRFVEADQSQMIGSKHPDTLYLKLTVSNPALGIDITEDLTLVVRNRGVVQEYFEV